MLLQHRIIYIIVGMLSMIFRAFLFLITVTPIARMKNSWGFFDYHTKVSKNAIMTIL